MRVLLTAFEPYGEWPENSSWLTLVELTRELPDWPHITTRLYPVDFTKVEEHLRQDLANKFDIALHLGQAPNASNICLEAIGLNAASDCAQAAHMPLVEGGPLAFASELPLDRLASELNSRQIPAHVSYHAGTYVCNATHYLSHYLIADNGLHTKSGFVHLPLCTTQVIATKRSAPSLPKQMCVEALRVILEVLAKMSADPDS